MIFPEALNKIHLLLASKSPRRKQLLTDAGFIFEAVDPIEIDESIPESISCTSAAQYLADLKAEANRSLLKMNAVLLTADTVVCLNGESLGKPVDEGDAIRMLKKLSGQMHTVTTGVCLLSSERKRVFSSVTKVWFKPISDDEIKYYIKHYKPFDKAGAYGIQEHIGLTAIEKIEGSYFNVMGLPVEKVYNELKSFIPLNI
jgi:septum formation protein